MMPPSTPMPLYERLLARRSASPPSLAPVRPSAAVVPWRRVDGGIEVYWVRRSPRLRFMGGWWAFPGGTLDAADVELELDAGPRGASSVSDHRMASDRADGDPDLGVDGGADLVPGLAVCALRELFEETGLLLAEPSPRTALDAQRARLLAGETGFGDLVGASRWTLSAAELVFAGRWLTPPFASLRFDNRFFLLHWPADRPTQPAIVSGELVEGGWIAPAAAIDRWRRGEAWLAPPILHILRVLADAGPDAGLDRLRSSTEADLGPLRHFELLPGVAILPLAVPTLPPATHTNAFLLGNRQVVVVDPAPGPGPELERLTAALRAARDRFGMILEAVWLTHHHRDHVRGAARVRELFDVPIAAHARSRPGLEAAGIAIDRPLADGERVVLDGDPPFPIEVVHTPGHTRGHIALLCGEPRRDGRRAAVVGDLVSALSTIVIDPPEGEMGAYLASLERLRSYRPSVLLPAHGPPITAADRRLAWFHRHRLEREEQVARAWHGGVREPLAVVDRVYGRLDPGLRQVAARQVEAHLEHLGRLGRLAR